MFVLLCNKLQQPDSKCFYYHDSNLYFISYLFALTVNDIIMQSFTPSSFMTLPTKVAHAPNSNNKE